MKIELFRIAVEAIADIEVNHDTFNAKCCWDKICKNDNRFISAQEFTSSARYRIGYRVSVCLLYTSPSPRD